MDGSVSQRKSVSNGNLWAKSWINIFSSVQKSPAAEVLMDVSDKVENTGSQHVDDEETSKQINAPVSSSFNLQLGLDMIMTYSPRKEENEVKDEI